MRAFFPPTALVVNLAIGAFVASAHAQPPSESPVPPPSEVSLPDEDPDLSQAGVQLEALHTPGGLTSQQAARRAV
ncbi:MAG: hypothetical protein ACODAG_04520, partial [Myxococcota bacterium]